ncbi:uncharacterized protein LOC122725243 [Manihot esculenta]|uniref:Uncharacterized protein n=1 Tax=Manihot esculenta TaxID=3983 RepID=A0A2C9UXQ5_MANES|nr:uncharacterized protein LOC122725243 [Manihot esculenta]OAY35825.1 hypothetical protein MANES_12G133600v8 [Manihot esculenta]
MRVSLEALAMADMDYVEWGMDVQEWERREEEEDGAPPPHLLAEEDEDEDFPLNLNFPGKLSHVEANQSRNEDENNVAQSEWWKAIFLMVKTIIRILIITWVDIRERCNS